MSQRIRIVGGGLTGVLAAFEAHRLGWRDIELHERFDVLGGDARPRLAHGRELRDNCIYFGGPGDPIVEALSAHGVAFETFDNRFGSVSPGLGGYTLFTQDFAGPAVETADTALSSLAGQSLAHRIAAYPEPVRELLDHYCRWHLGCDLSEVDGEAAAALGVNRVVPVLADIPALAAEKARSPKADALWGVPRALLGRTDNLQASLPVGGFHGFFETCRKVLEGLGVRLVFNSLVPPRQAMAELDDDQTLVWAADPTPLFKPIGMTPPSTIHKTFASYAFDVDFDGPCPAYVQNFTAMGPIFRVYVYETGGLLMGVAECVREGDPLEIKAQMRSLMSGLGTLEVGDLANVSMQPRWTYHSRAAMEGLKALRARLAETFGPRFVSGAWETCSKTEKFAEVNAALAAARLGDVALARTA